MTNFCSYRVLPAVGNFSPSEYSDCRILQNMLRIYTLQVATVERIFEIGHGRIFMKFRNRIAF
jgi:hypothetical protein